MVWPVAAGRQDNRAYRKHTLLETIENECADIIASNHRWLLICKMVQFATTMIWRNHRNGLIVR